MRDTRRALAVAMTGIAEDSLSLCYLLLLFSIYLSQNCSCPQQLQCFWVWHFPVFLRLGFIEADPATHQPMQQGNFPVFLRLDFIEAVLRKRKRPLSSSTFQSFLDWTSLRPDDPWMSHAFISNFPVFLRLDFIEAGHTRRLR
jgi:hypothetical protein